jgi:hypothetical protein
LAISARSGISITTVWRVEGIRSAASPSVSAAALRKSANGPEPLSWKPRTAASRSAASNSATMSAARACSNSSAGERSALSGPPRTSAS